MSQALTAEQIARVRASWSLALAAGDDFATAFYERLFEVAPEVRPLFAHADPAAQADKLAQTLEIIVRGLDDLPALQDEIAALGRRHAGYGATAGAYRLVGEVLVWTLARFVGPSFHDADRAAWASAYEALATVMQSTTATPAGVR